MEQLGDSWRNEDGILDAVLFGDMQYVALVCAASDKQNGFWDIWFSTFITSRKTLLLLALRRELQHLHYFVFITFFSRCWPDVSFSSSSSSHAWLAPSFYPLQSSSAILIHGFLSSYGLILEKQCIEPGWRQAMSATYGFIFHILLWPHAVIFQAITVCCY